MPRAKSIKSEKTREKILEVAFRLFMDIGYEKATMREIATACELSPGAAYYYFQAKENLIQVFYEKSHDDHYEAIQDILKTKKSLKNRLLAVMKKKIEVSEPSHEISRVLFKTASDAQSPLSPFSEETRSLREKNIGVFQEIVEGSNTKIPKDLRKRLPEYLWLYQMGIILYWINDFSTNRQKTYHLIEKTVDILAKLIAIANLPLMKPVRSTTMRLLEEFRFSNPANGKEPNLKLVIDDNEVN